jgi:hypothetical protein
VYSRALTAGEIQADMAAAIACDTVPPVRSNGQPTGTLPAGTTQTTLSLATNENATCRWAPSAGVAYTAMPTPFSTTGGTTHSTPVSGLTNGTSSSTTAAESLGLISLRPDRLNSRSE